MAATVQPRFGTTGWLGPGCRSTAAWGLRKPARPFSYRCRYRIVSSVNTPHFNIINLRCTFNDDAKFNNLDPDWFVKVIFTDLLFVHVICKSWPHPFSSPWDISLSRSISLAWVRRGICSLKTLYCAILIYKMFSSIALKAWLGRRWSHSVPHFFYQRVPGFFPFFCVEWWHMSFNVPFSSWNGGSWSW